MIDFIKQKLLEDPEKIKDLLEKFDFCKIHIHSSYISFARSQDSSPKSITIYLHNNDALIVKDWVTNTTCDIFNYIIKSRSVTFRDAITAAKNILGIDGSFYVEQRTTAPFGGMYSRIKSRSNQELKVYDDSILDKYVPCGNDRFLRDYISLETQRYFDIRYSVVDQSIVIPIYTPEGNLMGVKARANHDIKEDEQKYYYLVPCQMSQTLYGYSQNYEYLESTDIVYVVEAEKGCMQAYTYGYKNVVALGSGSISRKQVQLLLSLNPNKIVFLHDYGFQIESIERNIKMVKGYCKMKQVECGYWDYFGKYYEDKISCTDKGKEFFEYVIKNEIKYV